MKSTMEVAIALTSSVRVRYSVIADPRLLGAQLVCSAYAFAQNPVVSISDLLSTRPKLDSRCVVGVTHRLTTCPYLTFLNAAQSPTTPPNLHHRLPNL